jgi:hypothetical protein
MRRTLVASACWPQIPNRIAERVSRGVMADEDSIASPSWGSLSGCSIQRLEQGPWQMPHWAVIHLSPSLLLPSLLVQHPNSQNKISLIWTSPLHLWHLPFPFFCLGVCRFAGL